MKIYKAIAIIGLSFCSLLNYAYADQHTKDTIIGNSYLLYTINDVDVRSQFGQLPYIHFEKDDNGIIEVTGQICNDFTGSIAITDRTSITSDMISDKKVCENIVLNQLQYSINKFLDHSMVQENNGILTIYSNGSVIKMSQFMP